MKSDLLQQSVKDRVIHMVGIKGVGMTALAEILFSEGARLSGSDTAEVFFTDAILHRLGIPVAEGFAAENLPARLDCVIHSAAYVPASHPELVAALKKAIPCFSYPEALGALSRRSVSAGVSGIHGKTTTTAMAGVLCKALGLPVTVLVGSQVPGFDDHCTYQGGRKYFIAETCEYKRHFLFFKPAFIILTNVEEDHQDYFKSLTDIQDAFTEYAGSLEKGGRLIYAADDAGATAVAIRVRNSRPDLILIPYGFQADGRFRIVEASWEGGESRFRLSGFPSPFSLRLPGRHSILNATAALALCDALCETENLPVTEAALQKARAALRDFKGTRRRSEIIGESRGVLFMDDYAHHPTAILTTLAGIRKYYPKRRLIADFMPHTFSRTQALFSRFAESFTDADRVILHKIYASAREQNDGSVSGESLYEETKKHHPHALYFNEVMNAAGYLETNLNAGDLFITMGAGDNWRLSHELFRRFERMEKEL